jgi:hypothetical protein
MALSRALIALPGPAAFAATLSLGGVGYEAQANAKGERLVWLETAVADKLAAMRRARATAT